MRISTNTIYETGTNLMLQQQDTLIKTQQQLSTGRRLLLRRYSILLSRHQLINNIQLTVIVQVLRLDWKIMY